MVILVVSTEDVAAAGNVVVNIGVGSTMVDVSGSGVEVVVDVVVDVVVVDDDDDDVVVVVVVVGVCC